MASITIRNLDAAVKARLRVRAAQNGRSMEEEARTILSSAVVEQAVPTENMYQAIRRLFEPLGGMELELPPREAMRKPPTFD
jgi:plasmid stability protein